MRTHVMYQVDAFTNRVFTGNPAAVLVLEKEWLSDDLMQQIAAENNLAETAFARPNASAGWDLRWFTPVQEVDFCGHATLATGHVLATELGHPGTLVFATRVGELRVERFGDAYVLDLPAFPPERFEEPPDILAEICPTGWRTAFQSFENVFVELPDEATLRAFAPDLERVKMLFPSGLCVTAPGDHHDFVSRYFAPGAGIPEDPVTGGTHATLVPYWADRLGRTELSAFQCSKRGGELSCRLDGFRVRLTGHAVTFMSATIRLPC